MDIDELKKVLNTNPSIRNELMQIGVYISNRKIHSDLLSSEMMAVMINGELHLTDMGGTHGRVMRVGLDNSNDIIDVVVSSYPEMTFGNNQLSMKVNDIFADIETMYKVIDQIIINAIKLSIKSGTCRILGISKNEV